MTKLLTKQLTKLLTKLLTKDDKEMAKKQRRVSQQKGVNQGQPERSKMQTEQPAVNLNQSDWVGGKESYQEPEKEPEITLEPESLLLTVPQVCKLLNVSRSTVDRMAERGEIPGRMKLGGQVRYHRPTLQTWLEKKAQLPVLLDLLDQLPANTDEMTVQRFRIALRTQLAKQEETN